VGRGCCERWQWLNWNPLKRLAPSAATKPLRRGTARTLRPTRIVLLPGKPGILNLANQPNEHFLPVIHPTAIIHLKPDWMRPFTSGRMP